MRRRLLRCGAAAAVAFGALGCAVHARTGAAVYAEEPVVDVETAAVPVDVYAYPHYYYHGRVVYLVEDRWYTQSPRGWVVYRSEPTQLRSYRTRYYETRRARRAPEYGTPRPHQRRRYHPY
jgi:hypothetical protein